MNSLIVTISLLFFATGTAYGIGAGTVKSTNDVVNAMIKAIQGLGGLIFLLLVISQFLAYFNYTNMTTIAALSLADILQDDEPQRAVAPARVRHRRVRARPDHHRRHPEVGAVRAGVRAAPDAAQRRRRKRCWPPTGWAIRRSTRSRPLNAYFALIVTFAQKYQKDAGVGTVVALMLPYVVALMVVWPLLLAAWHLLGLPWGL